MHKDVCKNEEKARVWEEKFKKFRQESETPYFIKISIFCDNFELRFMKKEDGIREVK